MYLSKLFHTKTGKIVLSILLGLGLATLFRTVCKDKNCIVFKAPPLEEIQGKTYKYDNKCYQYTPKSAKCDKSKTIVSFA
jgi:hypothetical protein